MKLTGAALGVLSSGAALVQGVDIASGLSVLLPDLSQGNLAGLEDQLTKMVSNSGSTNAGLFDDLSRMINETMTPAILQAHADGQDTLNGLTEAFGHCTSAKQSDDSDSKVKDPTVVAKLKEHKTCRDNQNKAFEEAGKCGTTLNGLNTAKTAACNAVPGSDGVVPPVYTDDKHVGCEPIPNSYDTWVASLEHYLLGLKGQLDEAKAGCGNATKLADDKGPECTETSASVTSNKTACDALQVQADALACSAEASQSTACTAYVGCYGAAVNTLVEQNATIAAQQLNWTVQWRGLKRIQCLLAQESNGATHDGINACREATIDTSHLDLDYPVVPPFEECEATTEGPKPCSDDYLSAYGDLPLNAPALPCTPCPPPKIQCAEGVDVLIQSDEQKYLLRNQYQSDTFVFRNQVEGKGQTKQLGIWTLEVGFVEGRGQRTFIRRSGTRYYLESPGGDRLGSEGRRIGYSAEWQEWRIIAASSPNANRVYLMNYKGKYLSSSGCVEGCTQPGLGETDPAHPSDGSNYTRSFLWHITYVPAEGATYTQGTFDEAIGDHPEPACLHVIADPEPDCVWQPAANGWANPWMNLYGINTRYDLHGAKEACSKYAGCKGVTCDSRDNLCSLKDQTDLHTNGGHGYSYFPVVGKCHQNLKLGEYVKKDMVKVKGHHVTGSHEAYQHVLTASVDVCKNICDQDPSCTSFEYRRATSQCMPLNIVEWSKEAISDSQTDLYVKETTTVPTVPSVYDCNDDGTNECGVWSDAGAKCSNSATCSYDYKFGDMHLGQTCRCN